MGRNEAAGTGPSLGRRRAAYLLLSLSALFWSGNFVVGRAIRGEITPITLSFWRWAIALLVLLPLTWPDLWRARGTLRRRWPILLALGATGITGFHSSVYLALSATTAINAVLFLSATPVVIVVASWLLEREAASRRHLLGLAVSLAGVLVVIARGDPAVLLALRPNPGDLWMLAAVPMWAVYSVLLKRRPPELPPLALLAATVAAGLLCLVPLQLWELGHGARLTLDAGGVLALLYVALFASVLAFVAWNRGVAEVGANRAGLFMHLMPVFSAVLAVIFLGERVAVHHLAGAALVFLGIAVAGRGSR